MQPFISSADLSDYLRRSVTSDASRIALDSACEVVRGYIGQTLNLVEDDEVYIDGTGTRSLLLPQLPVVSIAEVTTFDINGEDETTLTEDVDFKIGDAGVLWRISAPGSTGWGLWPWGHRNIFVVYTHGYGVGPLATGSGDSGMTGDAFGVPSDIRLVALQIAGRVYSQSAVVAGGMQSETIGKYAYTLSDAGASSSLLYPEEQHILDRYRQRRVA